MSPIVVVGNAAIALAVAFSLFGIIAYVLGRRAESEMSLTAGRASVYGAFVAMTIANLAMIHGLLADDFAVSYVSRVGSVETPRWISAISLWSSLEGSLLFWGWILSGYSAVCVYFYRERERRLMPWVGMTVLFVQLFFYVLLAVPANPFLPVSPVPANGPGPNPLLQNHWLMAIHPPFLYMGYIGFTIPFAFSVAALCEARDGVAGSSSLPDQWVTMCRRWTLFAWSFLTMAIVLGGWWSYAVLGWGGYWAWDPVENASFMPWLSATALVHSVIVQEKRKMLPVWNLILAILTFLLTLLGTFLTRSGVLDSVHSFTESHVGPYFLVFIAWILTASVALLLWRAPKFRDPGRIENVFSLEVLFLFNNLLFVSFCFVVFLGTLYPLIAEALQGKRISVGEPYFDQMTVPIVGMILLLMGVALITPWKKAKLGSFVRSARWPSLLAILPTGICLALGGSKPVVLGMVYLAAFAFWVMALEMGRASSKGKGFFRLFSENPRRYGGFVAHLGALMIIVGVTLSSAYERDEEIPLAKGQSASVGDYTLTLNEIRGEQVPQRFEIKAEVQVEKDGTSLGVLAPQMNFYPITREPVGSPAIRTTLIEDLYLTLLHFEEDGSRATIHAIVTPGVAWIWIGGFVAMGGGFLALTLGRKNKAEAA